jgi:arsenate reductase (thioredoxin)
VTVSPPRALAISFGTQPAEHVHPLVVEAMLEVGIDFRDVQRQELSPELAQDAEILITMAVETNAVTFLSGLSNGNWQSYDHRTAWAKSGRVG